MTIRQRRGPARAVATLLSLLLAPGLAHAAGFSIFEQGGRGMGFAGAYTAQASDPSAIFHNAAGIAFLKGSQLYLGGTVVHPSSDFVGDDPFPGAGRRETGDVSLIPVPTLYYTHTFSDRVSFGLGVHSPYGLRTQWANPDSYSGRYLSLRADLKSLSVNPTISYKLEDRLAIGAGLDLRFSKVSLRRRVPAVHPFTQKIVDVAEVNLESNWNSGLGFNLGILAKPSERLSLGVAYRHKIKVDYDGQASFDLISSGNAQFDGLVANSLPSGSEDVVTGVEFPAIASGGVAYAWDRWTVEGDVVWYQWSTFDQLAIEFPNRSSLNEVIPELYKNSWQYRLGIERRIRDDWAVRGGYFYDQTPTPPASVTPLLPDASRHGFALGGSWTSGQVSFDVGAWYLKFKDRSTEGQSRDSYNGTYQNKALTFAASLGFRF